MFVNIQQHKNAYKYAVNAQIRICIERERKREVIGLTCKRGKRESIEMGKFCLRHVSIP